MAANRDSRVVDGEAYPDGGKRYVLVAIIQHPNANAARGALDALVNWTIRDTP